MLALMESAREGWLKKKSRRTLRGLPLTLRGEGEKGSWGLAPEGVQEGGLQLLARPENSPATIADSGYVTFTRGGLGVIIRINYWRWLGKE